MMGDYPLIVNGFTFESNPESKSRLIGVAAYSLSGSGNGSSVHKDSPYYDLADLKGKLVSVPFGSAAHGMVLKAMQDRGLRLRLLPARQPEPGGRLDQSQEKKIDAHADFVPFAELLPFRGFARKIFDGVETNLPTFHGIVVRTDFAEEIPRGHRCLLKALIAANPVVLRDDPKLAARKDPGVDRHQQGSRLYLPRSQAAKHDHRSHGEAGADDAAATDVKVLQNLGRMKEFASEEVGG
jgi:NitT/TauT family transport system substrate-binding protein